MKHVKQLTRSPKKAQDIGIGQIFTIIAQILTVLGGALTAKDEANA